MACGNVDKKIQKLRLYPRQKWIIPRPRWLLSRCSPMPAFFISAFDYASGHKQNITGTANIVPCTFCFVLCFILQNWIQAGSRRTTRAKLSVPSLLVQMTFMKIKRESNYATREIRESTPVCASYRRQHQWASLGPRESLKRPSSNELK